MVQALAEFEQLARADAAVAPLARLQAVALAAAEDAAWADSVPDLTRHPGSAEHDVPLLHDRTLTVDADRQRALLRRLASTLAASGSAEAGPLEALFTSRDFDPLALLTASIVQDQHAHEVLAARAGVDQAVLAVAGHTATLPLLMACGRRAADAVDALGWAHGYCPVCAAWPILAEIRGLARDFVLRCGRCASGWRFAPGGCIFCDGQERAPQGYFAAEQERESRRAAVCDACHGYLKTVATLGPLSPSDLLLRDLQSLELDVTALEHEYGRPDGLGWDLAVRIEPAIVRAGQRSDGSGARDGQRKRKVHGVGHDKGEGDGHNSGNNHGVGGWRRLWR